MASVPMSEEEMVRRIRAKEFMPWYDTIAVFKGANQLSNSWYDNFAAFATSDAMLWFRGQGRNVGYSYSNQVNDRLDYALDIYGVQVDYEAPLGMAKYDTDVVDTDIMPQKWVRDLPRRMSLRFRIAGTDELFVLPGCKIPSGEGPIGQNLNGLGSAVNDPGTNGLPLYQNMIPFPEPIQLPANQTFTVEGRVDDPLKSYLATLETCPEWENLPTCQPLNAAGARPTFLNKKVYTIRITLWGAAHRQLRGARSAAGATAR
jgi:hypothetical protein